MQHNTETKIWNATLYLRLSRDDGDKEESNSITGQRELLRDFIRTSPELREYAVRIDDGFTGSNFDRPSFKKMLEDVKAGRTNCIIVKDLSRLGRDYLTVRDYISRVFPFLGVRFVSVNDGFDSSNPLGIDSLDTSFRTLIYDLYSRNLFRRVKSAQKARAERGAFLSPYAPYGYAGPCAEIPLECQNALRENLRFL